MKTPGCCSVKPIPNVGTNEHSFSRYWLVERYGRREKFWNPLIEVGQLDSWYVGHECSKCGEQGFVIPA